jgi:hypothetical protein
LPSANCLSELLPRLSGSAAPDSIRLFKAQIVHSTSIREDFPVNDRDEFPELATEFLELSDILQKQMEA